MNECFQRPIPEPHNSKAGGKGAALMGVAIAKAYCLQDPAVKQQHVMPLHNVTTSALESKSVHCPRVDLAEASTLPSKDGVGSAWPVRTRTQYLDALLFTPRTLCTSPDEFPASVLPAGIALRLIPV